MRFIRNIDVQLDDINDERVHVEVKGLLVSVTITHEGVIVDVYPIDSNSDPYGEVLSTLCVEYPEEDDESY